MINNREKTVEVEELLPKCPKYPVQKKRFSSLKNFKAILIILGIFISGIGIATISDVQPTGNNDKNVISSENWQRVIEGNILRTLVTSDDNILVVGLDCAGCGMFFSKMDFSGKVIWKWGLSDDNTNHSTIGAYSMSSNNVKIMELSDSGFMIVWNYRDSGYPANFLKIVKTDNTGKILWTKQYMDTQYYTHQLYTAIRACLAPQEGEDPACIHELYSIIGFELVPTTEEILILNQSIIYNVTGVCDSINCDLITFPEESIIDQSTKVVKIDVNGAVVSTTTFHYPLNNIWRKIQIWGDFHVTNDHGYLLRALFNGSERWVTKFSNNGIFEWNFTLSTNMGTFAWLGDPYYHNQFDPLEVGDRYFFSGDDNRMVKVIEVTKNGELMSEFEQPGDFINSYRAISDGSILIGNDNEGKVQLIKLDTKLEREWNVKTSLTSTYYSGEPFESEFTTLIMERSTGKYFVAGSVIPSVIDLKVFESNGSESNSIVLGNSDVAFMQELLKTSDGGVVATAILYDKEYDTENNYYQRVNPRILITKIMNVSDSNFVSLNYKGSNANLLSFQFEPIFLTYIFGILPLTKIRRKRN